MKFRHDINGLRAIAVIAVALFHFSPEVLPGGFAGVDVFFVISGYLMTAIIVRGLENNELSLIKFYVARANRIIPALAVLCLALLVFGWFYLTPIDYKILGKHITGSLGFFSNVIYLKESGYFDTSAYSKWLLHTWSLSVEWQFYILYPLILLALSRLFGLHTTKKLIVAFTILLFSVSAFATFKWSDESYYLLPTRAWEMMMGGIAYLYPLNFNRRKSQIAEALGLLLILAAYFVVSSDTPWPGYLAILPVAGTFLVIIANRQDSFLTNNQLSQYVGLWSYSIYLWHWPVVVLFHYLNVQSSVALGMLISLLLGFASHKYVETIKWENTLNWKKALVIKPLIAAVLVLVISTVLTKIVNVQSSRYSEEVLTILNESENINPRRQECHVSEGTVPQCKYGSGEVKAIVLGDSHAQGIVRSVEKSLSKESSVLDWTMSGCRTVQGIYNIRSGSKDTSCGDFIEFALTEVKNYPNVPVIISNRFNALLFGVNEKSSNRVTELISSNNLEAKFGEAYTKSMSTAFIDTLCRFSKTNPIYLLEQTPELALNVPQTMAREYIKGNASYRVKIDKATYNKRNEAFSKIMNSLQKQCGVTIVSVQDKYCDELYCYGDHKGRPMFFDDDHLSEFGASFLIPSFKQILAE
ncbi:acyltransferase family protein [Vibrio sonorensis]|uniref:acyltransferase family protein n=1 Tax=Vibrio sonorensis TaxID=1004316 RepID=UPI0008DB2B87|nr:acyltransferase family protein [Vibrio sonorensis]